VIREIRPGTIACVTPVPDSPPDAGYCERESTAAPDHVTPRQRVAAFPETRWTHVLRASGVAGTARQDALNLLAERYRPAVREWFRRAGATPPDAEDLSQEFVLRILEGRVLDGFRRTDTRFRVFLQACLRNFLCDEWRRRMSQKRGGGVSFVELNESFVSAAERSAAERLDEEFVRLVHRRAVEQVEHTWGEKGFSQRLERLGRFIFAPPEPGDYEAEARELKVSVSVVKKTIFDLRQAYFEEVREQVLQAAGPEQVADELHYIVELLSRLR